MSACLRIPLAWSRVSAASGGALWLLSLAVPLGVDSPDRLTARAVQFALLVVIPLALAAVTRSATAPLTALFRLVMGIQPVAALLAALAFWFAPGPLAALLAAGWFAETLLIALTGLFQLRMARTAPSLCRTIGKALLPVGGGWLLAHRAGLHLGGFGPTLTLLVAMHYHYAGFAAPLLAGFAGDRLASRHVGQTIWRAYRLIAVGVCVGSPLIAIGASSTPIIEGGTVVVFAAALAGLAALMLGWVIPAISTPLCRVLLIISSSATLLAMGAAMIFAIGNATGRPTLTIAQMAMIHGSANALGFVLCGLLAWNLASPDITVPSAVPRMP